MNRDLLLTLLLTTIGAGCGRGLDKTPDEVEAEVATALGKSADTDEIENYLLKRNLGFSYDRFANRYQAIIRDPSSDAHAITIYILLDGEGRFADVEAHESFTMP